MRAQPTLTRLFALLAFSGFASYCDDGFSRCRTSAQVSRWLTSVAVLAAFAGWRVAGPAYRKPSNRCSACLQGHDRGLSCWRWRSAPPRDSFALATRPATTSGDAIAGLFRLLSQKVQTVAVPELSACPWRSSALVSGVGLSVLFRLLEHRRTAAMTDPRFLCSDAAPCAAARRGSWAARLGAGRTTAGPHCSRCGRLPGSDRPSGCARRGAGAMARCRATGAIGPV